jgi:hypothetical protein
MTHAPIRTLILVGFSMCAGRAQAFDPGEAAGTWRILNF